MKKVLLIFVALAGCASEAVKEKTIVVVHNSPKDDIYALSARVQILTSHQTGDCRCGDINQPFYFNLSDELVSGYFIKGLDTIKLYCSSFDDIKNSNQYVRDSLYLPERTANNFWIGKNFNYMSLYQIDSVVKQLMSNLDGFYYFTTNGQKKLLSLKNSLIEYKYYFGTEEVQAKDSLFFVKMKNLKPPPLPF